MFGQRDSVSSSVEAEDFGDVKHCLIKTALRILGYSPQTSISVDFYQFEVYLWTCSFMQSPPKVVTLRSLKMCQRNRYEMV